MKWLFVIGALLLSLAYVDAQRTCGTMDELAEQLEEDPGMRRRMDAIERHTRQALDRPRRITDDVITIPVVVHIVWNQPEENLSEEQIQSQIDVLNEDFRRLNADTNDLWPQAADSQIEFCLARTDPDGFPTCGITRTETDVTSFSSSGNPVKFTSSGGIDAWPSGQYLNIWVCDLSGSLLGYAQFPGGNASTDGIVVDYYNFGRIGNLNPDFALGRTGTHEVGHWLNLRHIWGDGACNRDDFVADTPTSDAANYDCDVGHVSCGTEDMVQNYMDYSDDDCMNIYTEGQKGRMRALFEPGGFRESLLFSNGCATEELCTQATLSITLDDYPNETTWEIVDSVTGGVVASGGPYSGQDFETIAENICLVSGTYILTMYDSYGDGICCGYGEGSYELTQDTLILVSSNGEFEFEESTVFDFTSNGAFVFVGPGTDWFDASNWNTGRVPGDCFYGTIRIASDCIASGAGPFADDVTVIVESGVTLTWQ